MTRALCKLHICRIEAVDVQKRHRLKQLALHRSAVIHIHELARNQPPPHPASGHPPVADRKEIAVEASQSADLYPAGRLGALPQTLLFAAGKMVMTHRGGLHTSRLNL